MDPLSITASVIAILTLTTEVISYIQVATGAPKEWRQYAIEALNIQTLLTNLRFHLEDADINDPWFKSVATLRIKDGPLDQFEAALRLLKSKVSVETDTVKRMLWKLNKAEADSVVQRMERLKSLVNVALEMDHL